jgi:hypothetical protein
MAALSEFESSEISVVVSDICCYIFLYAQREKLRNGEKIIPIEGFSLTTKPFELNNKIDWPLMFNELNNTLIGFGFSNEWLVNIHSCIDKNRSTRPLQESINDLKAGLTTLSKLAIAQSKMPIPVESGLNHSKKTISYALLTVYKIYEWDWSNKPDALSMVNRVLLLNKTLGIDRMMLTKFCECFLDYLDKRNSFFKDMLTNIKI